MKLLVLTIFITVLGSCSSSKKHEPEITIEFSKRIGKIKPINGINCGPFQRSWRDSAYIAYHAEAGFPYTRLHDDHMPYPDVVDINTIFPLFHADPDDPRNYLFEKTDDYLAPIIKNKSDIVYRLGQSIEHFSNYYINPPKDYEKWAKICINIIRHYNDGWADGFYYNIKYWEIWNEPEVGGNAAEKRLMWTGTMEEYYKLYEVTSKAIKAYNPELKIGGPAATSSHSKIVEPFLAYCRDHSAPLDFFSWHYYSADPYRVVSDAGIARKQLDKYGFNNAESHLNEWHLVYSFKGLRAKDPAKWPEVKKNIEKINGPEGAVYTASVLMLLQDCSVDVANYYDGKDKHWGLFDTNGPVKTYYVFKAFNELRKLSGRVGIKTPSKDNKVVMCAAMSEERENAAILASNAHPEEKSYQIALKDFHSSDKIRSEIYIIDQTHDLDSTETYEIVSKNPVLRLKLPPKSVCLIKLSGI